MASCMVLCTIAISGRGKYTDLTVRLPDSGEEDLEVSLELVSLLALYSIAVSVNISLWEDVVVLEVSELLALLVTSLLVWEGVLNSSQMVLFGRLWWSWQ